jgi:hypothetical protein
MTINPSGGNTHMMITRHSLQLEVCCAIHWGGSNPQYHKEQVLPELFCMPCAKRLLGWKHPGTQKLQQWQNSFMCWYGYCKIEISMAAFRY